MSGLRQPIRLLVRGDDGSAPAEFVMVSGLLVVLVAAVLQLALAMHVRTTLLDAAAEGARFAALADSDSAAGAARTAQLIETAIGPDYAQDISVRDESAGGAPTAVVTVRAPLPIAGLLGVADGIQVTAHAPLEKVRDD